MTTTQPLEIATTINNKTRWYMKKYSYITIVRKNEKSIFGRLKEYVYKRSFNILQIFREINT